ncbi:hypothetical protein STVIR_2548 [Streptomyces viridochromogenes Tue57]|uniref:Uncharacterized protein n=2 Tax=Streptomyces viridochromogenes TaxID=1938 RepID=L8PJ21_STRVR|nr:hypothetical protein STVIR_2548 [Streptomyces viridochromogenes Tue57]
MHFVHGAQHGRGADGVELACFAGRTQRDLTLDTMAASFTRP